MKYVKVTDSFLSLDENVIKCQNDKTFEQCLTQNYLESFMKKHKCLPIQVRLSTKVLQFSNFLYNLNGLV